MAYVNPIDLLAPYLTPLTANINQGIGTGINLVNLQNQTLHNAAANDLARQQIEASKAQEQRSIAEANRVNAELARRSKVGEGYAKAFAPITETTPIMQSVPSPLPPATTFTGGDPLDHLTLSPEENAAILNMPEPTQIQTGVNTTTRPLTMREAVQRALAVSGQTPEEYQKLLGTGQTIENQAELTSTRDEANRIRDEYQGKINELNWAKLQSADANERDKIDNQIKAIETRMEYLKEIAGMNNAARLAMPEKSSPIEKRMAAFNADRERRKLPTYNFEQYQRYEAKLYGPLGRMGVDAGAGSGKKSYEQYE